MKVGIFHTAFIGDLALCGLLVEALYLENHEISLIVKKPSAILYKEDFRIKNLIAIEKKQGLKKIKSIFSIAEEIKKLDLDVILVPHQSATSAMCVYASKVKKRVSYVSSSFSFLYSELRKFNRDEHECIRCLNLAPEWLVSDSIRNKLLSFKRPILNPTQNFDRFLNVFPNFFSTQKDFFIVNPGSVWATKKYPLDYLAIAIRILMTQNKKIGCVISGGPQEKNDINKLIKYIDISGNLKNRVYNASDCLPLNELVSLSAKAQFVIANDSSPLHIASGTNTPVIGIFGPTSWETGFAPVSDRNKILYYKDDKNKLLSCHPCSKHGHAICPKKHFRCMRDLAPHYLVESVIKLVPELFL